MYAWSLLILSFLIGLLGQGCGRSDVSEFAEPSEQRLPGGLLRLVYPMEFDSPGSEVSGLLDIGGGRFLASGHGEVVEFTWGDGRWTERAVLKTEEETPWLRMIGLVECLQAGRKDLVTYSGPKNVVELYPGRPDGSFRDEPIVLREVEDNRQFALLKEGECGTLAAIAGDELSVQEILSDGTLSEGPTFQLPGEHYYHLTSDDLHEKGMQELFAKEHARNRVVAIDPLTGEERTVVQGHEINLQDFAIGDLNGDGLLDLVTGPFGEDRDAAQLGIFINAGDGTLRPPRFTPGPRDLWEPVIADFDGDGLADIAWRLGIQESLGISFQRATGSFENRIIWSGDMSRLGSVSTPEGEVLIANRVYHPGVLAFSREGHGEWAGRAGVWLRTKGASLLSWNSDEGGGLTHIASLPDVGALSVVGEDMIPSRLDLGESIPGPLVEVDFGCGPERHVVVLDNSKRDPSGRVVRFGSAGPSVVHEFEHSTATDAVAVDVDGNGWEEIVLVGFSGGAHLEVIWNDGNCSFERQTFQKLLSGRTPMAISVGDFTRKGRQEFAIADFGAGSVTVLIPEEGGGWSEVGRVEELGTPIAMEICDWDGEPGDEVLVVSFFEGTVEVLRVDEEGHETLDRFQNFIPEWSRDTEIPLRSLVAGDFDGDGRCDFISGGESGTYLGVMSRNDRIPDDGRLFFMSAGTPLAMDFIEHDGEPHLVYVSGGDNVLVRAKMEFIPATGEAGE